MGFISVAWMAFVAVSVPSVALCIYRLFLHPLAKFPGPTIAAFSDIWYAWSWIRGRYPFLIAEAHQKYGDVVRIAPNQLSFATTSSYQSIYTRNAKDQHTFLKGPWYDSDFAKEPGVASVRDPLQHAEQRRSLSPAFSQRALMQQAGIVYHYADLFVEQLARHASDKPVNIVDWYNYFTFDVIGDLAFGEPFGALESGQSHVWISQIIDGSFFGMLYNVFKRAPIMRLLTKFFIPKGAAEKMREHLQMSEQKLLRRLNRKSNRDDFFNHVLQKGPVNKDRLLTEATTLIVAGSETTSSFFSGVTYYLLANPGKLAKLTEEIRSAFDTSAEIDADRASQLPYLGAVCEEALRLFPPAAFGLERVVPSCGAFIDGHRIPGGVLVSTDTWTTAHSPKYWHKPDEFWPERWLPDCPVKFRGDAKAASKPFSLGPRACLGVNLAYLEMRTLLAKLIWNFDLAWCNPELDWSREIQLHLLWKKPPVMVKVLPVNRR